VSTNTANKINVHAENRDECDSKVYAISTLEY